MRHEKDIYGQAPPVSVVAVKSAPLRLRRKFIDMDQIDVRTKKLPEHHKAKAAAAGKSRS